MLRAPLSHNRDFDYNAQTPAEPLAQNIVAEFIDDPLPALYEVITADTSGLDIMYAGKRIDTEVRSRLKAVGISFYFGDTTSGVSCMFSFMARIHPAWCWGRHCYSLVRRCMYQYS